MNRPGSTAAMASLLVGMTLFGTPWISDARAEPVPHRPNIVLILADDPRDAVPR